MRIIDADIHLIDLETRFPFKYGIATMTCAPYAFVRVRVEENGRSAVGVAADLLPPKWFTKIPEKDPRAEIDEMLAVIMHAVEAATGMEAGTAFDLWQELSARQDSWGAEQGFPRLLSGFGTSLIERAVIEATCKLHGASFADAVHRNLLGIRLGDVDEDLAGIEAGELLPARPLSRVITRHTIGMADALTDDDISTLDRLNDGLPQSLAKCIERYGLRHFKLKVFGDFERDVERVGRIADVIGRQATADFAFSMDGNEQFRALDEFRDFWQALTNVGSLKSFLTHLLFVEQPFHRDVALDPDALSGLTDWNSRPRIIIDESDAEPDSMRRALALGYHGTSHKNCKGVFKSIINACTLQWQRRNDVTSELMMSGEDLANVGPVALLQDLAVAATLGVESVERNGHHYFAGLSAFPQSVQQQMLAAHGDLYHASAAGWPTLTIKGGTLNLDSVNRAPLGVGFDIDADLFSTIDEWQASNSV